MNNTTEERLGKTFVRVLEFFNAFQTQRVLWTFLVLKVTSLVPGRMTHPSCRTSRGVVQVLNSNPRNHVIVVTSPWFYKCDSSRSCSARFQAKANFCTMGWITPWIHICSDLQSHHGYPGSVTPLSQGSWRGCKTFILDSLSSPQPMSLFQYFIKVAFTSRLHWNTFFDSFCLLSVNFRISSFFSFMNFLDLCYFDAVLQNPSVHEIKEKTQFP